MIERPLYLNRLMSYVDTPFIKILSGVRRCGKSTLMLMLMQRLREERHIPEERLVSLRLDSPEHADLDMKNLYALLKGRRHATGTTYFFLDEIQEIDGWERVVNTLNEEGGADIYVTGSNSRMMSSEISTYLTGRYVSLRIFPLSFAEFLSFRKTYTKLRSTHEELAEYLKRGGFPAVNLKDWNLAEIYDIVRDIYNSMVFTDIVGRHQIRRLDLLERVVKYTFGNIGNTYSIKAIADYFKAERRKVDPETVSDYLKMLESAFLLHRCSRYDVKGKELLKTQEKFYLADPALRHCVHGYTHDSAASCLENIVYLELMRRGYAVNVVKTPTGEVDFMASSPERRLYVQVSQTVATEDTFRPEYSRLIEIPDNHPKYVLSTDEFTGGTADGIISMHVADFLLSGEY